MVSYEHFFVYFLQLILLKESIAASICETNVEQNDVLCSTFEGMKTYKPDWMSLDSRPLPQWYDQSKLGIFVHWGVFSVPSFGSEWFWHNWKGARSSKYEDFMKRNYPPNFSYQDFARDFTAEFFNAAQWAQMFKASGAKYVVLTSKHHEGYTLWPSKHSFSWNALEVGPHRDIIAELSAAVRKEGMKFGLYYSLYEWFNPLYLADKSQNFTSDTYVTNKALPELREIISIYKPDVLWSDGDWEAPDTYWKAKEFLAWLYNESPVKNSIVVNDRWGREIPCHHGDFYTCKDRYNPGVLQKHKWENCLTIDKVSWGFRRNAQFSDYMNLSQLLKELIETVSCGGNMLMNVGPTKDGVINPIFAERLRDMGSWLSINGEAIYNTKPWKVQNDTLSGNVWYTESKTTGAIYIMFLSWPKDNVMRLADAKPTDKSQFTLLGSKEKLKWNSYNGQISIVIPTEAHRGQSAWVIRMEKTKLL